MQIFEFSFWWIYMFWYVLNAVWLFLGNVCLYVWNRNFVASVVTEFNETSCLVLFKCKLMSINFWWKSLNRWQCSFTFSKIFGICWSKFLVDKIAQKIIYEISIIRNIIDAIWVHIIDQFGFYFGYPSLPVPWKI